jgi:glycosyltransferase involved in cell wall biosynthesis
VHVIGLPAHSRRPLLRALRNGRRLVLGTPPLVHRFADRGREIQSFVAGRAYAVTVIGRLWCAPYREQTAPSSQRTVLDVVDVESVLFTRYAQISRWPTAAAYRRFRDLSLALERLWFPRYTTVLAASPDDQRTIRAIAPGADVVVYPNAIPAVEPTARPEEDVVVLAGNFQYPPNISAVRFFRGEIWPRLRARWPGLVWRLVGKNPQCVRRYVGDDPRIQLAGPVADAVAEIAAARVAVVPILVGSGTRVKILEAWAAGRAVVTTTIGAEGLAVRSGDNALLADAPGPFADAVSALLESPDLRHRLGRAGRATFERAYTWDAAWRQLDASGRV